MSNFNLYDTTRHHNSPSGNIQRVLSIYAARIYRTLPKTHFDLDFDPKISKISRQIIRRNDERMQLEKQINIKRDVLRSPIAFLLS